MDYTNITWTVIWYFKARGNHLLYLDSSDSCMEIVLITYFALMKYCTFYFTHLIPEYKDKLYISFLEYHFQCCKFMFCFLISLVLEINIDIMLPT